MGIRRRAGLTGKPYRRTSRSDDSFIAYMIVFWFIFGLCTFGLGWIMLPIVIIPLLLAR